MVKLVFPLALCIVDMKGAHTLCGMFDAYTNVYRPCVSCDCTEDDLDNPNVKCKDIIGNDMIQIIKDHSEDELRYYSQHKLEINAFNNVNIGGWKYGIWGLCPSEILHQFYEGLLAYTLDFFFGTLLTERSRNNLNFAVQKVIESCKNQSDRTFPTATYTMGITYSSKMKGTEKFAAIFYLSLYFYTKISSNLFDGCHNRSLSDSSIKAWRKLFEKILFYRDWIMQKEFLRSDVLEKQVIVVELFRSFQRLVKRTEGSGLKVPKLHELLHSCRDILRHGPARGYDTCPTESNHRPLKQLSHNTQRIRNRFEEQTAKRMYEENVIITSWKNTSISSINKLSNTNTASSTHESSHFIKSSLMGKFFITREFNSSSSRNNSSVTLKFVDSIGGPNVSNIIDFSDSLSSFINNNILCYLKDTYLHIKCYSTYKRDGIIFYGFSRDQNTRRNNQSWAIFKWCIGEDIFDYVPGKCLLFIDMKDLEYKIDDQVYEPEVHVIIESLQKPPKVSDGNNVKIAEKVSIDQKYHYYCVSVNTIHDSAFVIPDVGNSNTDQYLYVYPRDNWKKFL